MAQEYGVIITYYNPALDTDFKAQFETLRGAEMMIEGLKKRDIEFEIDGI